MEEPSKATYLFISLEIDLKATASLPPLTSTKKPIVTMRL
jgi:hypothetical protein